MQAEHAPIGRICPVCERAFTRKPSEVRAVNYCSVSCSAKANMKLTPARRGEHRARGTEFRQGERPGNWLPVGTERIRTRRGVSRAWVKVANPNTWRMRAVVSWEAVNGPVPKGRIIHHADRNPLNDDPSNLHALTRAQHLAEHRSDWAPVHAGNPRVG